MSSSEGVEVCIVGGSIGAWILAQELLKQDPNVLITVIEKTDVGSITVEDETSHKRQSHVISSKGRRKMFVNFPELQHQLHTLNAPVLGWGTDHVEVTFPGENDSQLTMLTQNHYIGVTTQSVRRTTLEYLLRTAVLSSGRVTLVRNVEVTGLMVADGRVNGVRIGDDVDLNLPSTFDYDTRGWFLKAKNVILAVGARTDWKKWFTAAGLSVPKTKVVDAGLKYMTAQYDSIQWPGKTRLFATGHNPNRAMIISRVDDDPDQKEGTQNNLATIYAYDLDKLPKTSDEFAAVADSFSHRGAAYLRTGKMVGTVLPYLHCESKMHLLWEMDDCPEGVWVFGDAAGFMNPRFGQGLTLEVLGAEILAWELFHGNVRSYNKKLKGVLGPSWTMATAADISVLRAKGVTAYGQASRFEKGMQSYMDFLLSNAGGDENWQIAATFFGVSNFEMPFYALVYPNVLTVAGKAYLKQRRRKQTQIFD